MRQMSSILVLVAAAAVSGCGDKVPARDASSASREVSPAMSQQSGPAQAQPRSAPKTETATLGGGCFWCLEAAFQELRGVISVESGYSGGHSDHPSYEAVCTGTTGHAEVCQITYDPAILGFKDVLEVFWKIHDPTTLNRQGNDVGTQYRSVIFYHDESQRALAEKYKKDLDASGAFRGPIVTEIAPFRKFWKAEEYHQNFFRTHPNQGYCAYVIAPKMDKFRHVFAEKLK